MDAIEELRQLVIEEKPRIVRRWAKRLRIELHEVEVARRDVRLPLEGMIDELGRLLDHRGVDALRLWPEAVRSHGARRYDQRFDADDLIREFKVLQQVLLEVYEQRHGKLTLAYAEVVAELVGEVTAAVEAAYARVLRTEEVRFRDAAVMESVLHHVDVGIMVVELDGTVSFVTPPVQRLLGVPVRILAGARSSNILGPVLAQIHAHHATGDPFRAADMPYVRALKEKRSVRATTMLIQRGEHDERVLELNAIPLYEEGQEGEMIGVIQTLVDRTDTAKKTRELSQAYDELRRLQGRLLQRTRTQALGQLASGAAHALNNFLNVLRLRITLLRREFKPEHVDALDRTVRSIGDLVARLQEFSSARTEEEVRDANLDEVLTEALQLARPEFDHAEHPIALESQLDGHGNVRVDVGYFRELLVNLLFAARDRLTEGGKVTLRTERDGEWLRVFIRDTGEAYPEDELGRMFDPLKSRARPHLSLLLGVARHQVQRWGGELQARNVEGGGAEFTLRLPEVAAQQAEAEPEPERRPVIRRFQQTRRVLVVDDDPDNARMLAQVLSDEGYEVQIAQTGKDALRLWNGTTRFDAALLDVMMPDVSGFELARNIRHQSPQALIAVVTGADVRGQNRANLALVDAVFRKPIDVEALDDFLSQSAEAPATEETPARH